MKNKILGNKLFKSGKVLIAVAGVSVIMTNAVIPVISTASANTNKVTPVHTASNWRANDQKNVDNNMRSQGIDSIASLNKNTTAAYLQKPTNVYRRSDSNNSTSNTEQKQVVAVNHDYSVTANNNVTDKAAAKKAAANKAAADKAAASLNMNLAASGIDTVGKYAKRLFVSLNGFDGRPMTVTGIKVTEGNGLTTSYTEEQLQGMGFNVNLTAGNGLYAYLPSQVGTQGWDTSNLTVNVDVKLENGQTTTLTDKIIPSPSNEDDSIR